MTHCATTIPNSAGGSRVPPVQGRRQGWHGKSNKTDGTRLVEQKQAETLDKARHTASKKGLQVFMKDAHFS